RLRTNFFTGATLTLEAAAFRRETSLAKDKGLRHWNVLHQFIHQNGGVVTSIPGLKRMRVEVPPDSNLATKLVEGGYAVHHHADESRIRLGKFERVMLLEVLLA